MVYLLPLLLPRVLLRLVPAAPPQLLGTLARRPWAVPQHVLEELHHVPQHVRHGRLQQMGLLFLHRRLGVVAPVRLLPLAALLLAVARLLLRGLPDTPPPRREAVALRLQQVELLLRLAWHLLAPLALALLPLLLAGALLAEQPLEQLPLVVLEPAVLLQPGLPRPLLERKELPRDAAAALEPTHHRPLEEGLEEPREHRLHPRRVVLLAALVGAALDRLVLALPFLLLVEQRVTRLALEELLALERESGVGYLHRASVPP
ncbi:hypothetical protein [Mumia zhuanghuii]|uniref:Uncharacterized protein n=1 Tax=Mumia zhuanghuii TaxID=2585211 RepID=A0A5C4MES8_9ACTN|nr:hypothetical protein [Mumia zhuanghuii]TNC35594.1 hypothetical protein FHE65_26975 [Mumia zhuanghuii]